MGKMEGGVLRRIADGMQFSSAAAQDGIPFIVMFASGFAVAAASEQANTVPAQLAIVFQLLRVFLETGMVKAPQRNI